MQIQERVSKHNRVGVDGVADVNREKEATANMDISKSTVGPTKMNFHDKTAKPSTMRNMIPPDRLDKIHRNEIHRKIIRLAFDQTNGEDLKNTNIVDSSRSQGFLAPGTPQEPIGDNVGTIITPVPHLTELGTSTLAQLYQSSRRSRSSPTNTKTKTSNPAVIDLQAIPPPPLTIPLPSVGRQKLHDLNVANDDASDDEWHFNMASPMSRSCSAMSLSSMESEDEDLLL